MLAKVVAHGADRAERPPRAARRARRAPGCAGIETNLGAAPRRSSRRAGVRRRRGRTATLGARLDALPHDRGARAGTLTTVQDRPGRTRATGRSASRRAGRWTTGRSALGNRASATRRAPRPGVHARPGRRCASPRDDLVCLTGAHDDATLDGDAGAVVGAGRGRRRADLRLGASPDRAAHLPRWSRGGFDVPRYLGSAATFTLGGFGGHGGRGAAAGDVLRLAPAGLGCRAAAPVRCRERPVLTSQWELGVVDGPHAAPEFFTAPTSTRSSPPTGASTTTRRAPACGWSGPSPEWARADGGEAGLHPSNIHDTAVRGRRGRLHRRHADHPRPRRPEPGRVRLPGDRVSAERWKLGQLAPGDTVRFVPVVDGTRGRSRRAVAARRVGCDRAAERRRRGVLGGAATRRRRHAAGDATGAAATTTCSSSTGRWCSTWRCGCACTRSTEWLAAPTACPASSTSRPASARCRCTSTRTRCRSPAAARRCSRGRGRAAPDSTTLVVPSRDRPPAAVLGRSRHPRGHRALHERSCATTRPGARGTSSSSAASTASTTSTTCAAIVFDAELPRARPRRRLPRRAGRHAARSPAPAGHHQVQPGAHLDAGERRRHRRRVPVRLRHGRARRLPVRRPHRAGVEPLRRRARTSIRRRRGCCGSSTASAGTRSTPTSCSDLRAERACRTPRRSTSRRATFALADHRAVPRPRRRANRRVPRPARRPRSPPSAPPGRRRASSQPRLEAAAVDPAVAEDALGGPLPGGAFVVEAPMHACVWRVDVREGDVVAPGSGSGRPWRR